MTQIVSYLTPLIFLFSGARSILYPESEKWVLLVFVLLSPVIIGLFAYEARS